MVFKRFMHLGVIALTFGAGVGTFSLRKTMLRQNPPPALMLQVPPTAVVATTDVKRTYQSRMHAYGLAGRHEACFGDFSSSDGMNFSSTNIYFDSPQQARRELQKRLKTALEILAREKSLDEAGRVVGEQVVATFPPYGVAYPFGTIACHQRLRFCID
jgi:hypothetical protein